MARATDVTQLLVQWRGGDEDALDQLVPLVYDELRSIAGRYMRAERADHTLQATALVHEAYARLVKSDVAYKDRVHFFAIAARAMRRVLVDHAKARKRQKRGDGAVKVTFDEAVLISPQDPAAIIDLDEALTRLTAFDERKARIIELHFFGGLTYDETAEALNISPATVNRDLKLAKAWLYRELQEPPNESD